MANVNSAFGLKPVRHQTGGNIQSNMYPIASAYNTAIYTGDPVIMAADGTITIAIGSAGSHSTNTLGVFGGVTFKDASGITWWRPYWPANQIATEIKAIVYDDPYIIFAIQSDATGAADADVGQLADYTIAAGNALTGKSATVLGMAATHATTAHQLRILRLVNDGVNASGAYSVVEVLFAEHAMKGVVSGVGGI